MLDVLLIGYLQRMKLFLLCNECGLYDKRDQLWRCRPCIEDLGFETGYTLPVSDYGFLSFLTASGSEGREAAEAAAAEAVGGGAGEGATAEASQSAW